MHRKRKAPRINSKTAYSPAAAAVFLGVTADTVKSYCRTKKLKAEQVGPKNEWRIKGSAIRRLRRKWKLDSMM